jgi:hypothetical protein
MQAVSRLVEPKADMCCMVGVQPTIINDEKLGRDTSILQTAQAVHDALGRNSEVECIPGAPPKHIQRLGYLLLRPASKLNSQAICLCTDNTQSHRTEMCALLCRPELQQEVMHLHKVLAAQDKTHMTNPSEQVAAPTSLTCFAEVENEKLDHEGLQRLSSA